MHNRDASKNGNHNLGGSMKPMRSHFHMADGGAVSVPIPKLDPAKAARNEAREAKKPAVDDTPLGRSFFDVVRDRGRDLDAAEERMVKPQKKADGGRVRLADGGDPFKSNDDGGGGAWAAREDYEARQAPPEVKDADTLNSDPARAAATEAAGPPSPAAEAAPSAMPKEITTLTQAEKDKAGAVAGAAAAKSDTQKRMERGAANAVHIAGVMNPSVGAGYEAGKAARKVADGEDQVSRATKDKGEEPKSKSEASHPVVEGLKKLGGMFAAKSQRNRGYEQDAAPKKQTADETSTKTSTPATPAKPGVSPMNDPTLKAMDAEITRWGDKKK